MLDTASDGERRNILASFTFDGNGDDAKVSAVRMYATSNGNTIGKELDITVTKNGYSDTKIADERLSAKLSYQ